MLRQSTTYLERDSSTPDDYGEPTRYRLHDESESIDSLPSFAELRDRFGRCEGKVYRTVGEEDIPCGYVFARRERRYDRSVGWDDPAQFYTVETWVTFERVSVSAVNIECR